MPLVRPGVRMLLRLAVRGGRGREVDEEIASLLALRALQLERQGMSPEQARAEALRRFGALGESRRRLLHAASSRERRMTILDHAGAVGHDVAYGWRQLRRSPGFAAAAVALLALGIGANAAMFGVVDRLFLRPPPGITDADRLRNVYIHTSPSAYGEHIFGTFSYPLYEDLRARASAFDRVAAWMGPRPIALGRGPAAREVRATAVSDGYFATLGVRPEIGRFFTETETRKSASEHVAVISDAMWRRDFAGSRDVLGRQLDLGASPFTIVGVAPPGFAGATLGSNDIWVPVSTAAEAFPVLRAGWLDSRGSKWINIAAHLRPGASEGQATAQVTATFRAGTREAGGGTDSLATGVLGSMIPGQAPSIAPRPENRVATLVFGVSILVLVIAWANTANLLLARALRRQREIAVRLALGVSRARLGRLLVAESLMLAVIAGAAAILVAWLGNRVASAVLFTNGAARESPLDARLLAFTAAIAVLTGLVTGLVPAWRVSRADLTGALKQGPREGMGHRSRARAVLLVVQGALSVVLLIGAGLFLRSLREIQSLDVGFDLDRLLYVSVNANNIGLTPPEKSALFDRLLERARAMPGVENAALTVGSPFQMSFAVSVRTPGVDSMPTIRDGGPYIYAVSPSFLRTMGTRIVRGRDLTDADLGNRHVAVVNATMARIVWPGRDPIGQCLLVDQDSTCTEVVGVAASSRRSSIVGDTTMQYFVPITHALTTQPRMLIVRTAGPAAAAAEQVRRVLQASELNLPYVSAQSMSGIVAPQLRSWRLGATMFGLFGVLALLLGTLGAYSVLSYAVAQRTHEMGVRLALGARRADVIRLVLGHGITAAALSIGIGIILALASGRFIQGLLFHVSPHDPLVFGLVVALLLVTATVAGVVPALRASRVDPVRSLRVD